MKKVFMIGALVLSIGGFAAARGMGYGGGMGYGNGHHGGCGGGGYHYQMMANNPDMQKSWITIEEKRLDVRKEMIKTSPDWKKIEKLNTDIATEQAKMRTAMEKYMRENPNANYTNTR
ncbi:hypothetical protein [Sebaldella sp. S0638]|uniref:hypothetical protein n=1 Tax=Sebaldella sp. S0638 TaxID=2957809 RepID=UPI00209D9018|nr:hypothetical protein [Sebaldella sp. S0638]MCP1226111.1 hypothetical protein [Sebaldella sp. S0638]